MRITRKHLEAKVAIVNALLGFGDDVPLGTVGAIELAGAYGGHGVHRVLTEGHAIEDLMGGYFSAREVQQFLSGMIAALRLQDR